MSGSNSYCFGPIPTLARLALFSASLLCDTAACAQISPSAITVGSPIDGTHITSPAFIRAHNIGCDGLPPTTFGFSIDDASQIIPGENSYDVDIPGHNLSAGAHAIVFKSSTSAGACPDVPVSVIVDDPRGNHVTNPAKATVPAIPANAISSGDLDHSSKWAENHDGGTPGKSAGATKYPAKTPVYDDAREFSMTYSDRAGERWSNQFVKDSNATHFVLDTYILLPNPSEVENVELDINQVISTGQTVILSTQCSGTNGSWEYGDTVGRHDHWKSTKIKCNPAEWSANVWHHVQIGMHRDGITGYVTHDWVTFDGAYNAFEDATLESIQSLGWGKADINTQFQIEGSSEGKGSVTAFVHKFTVYRW